MSGANSIRVCCCDECPCPSVTTCAHCGGCTPTSFVVRFSGITLKDGCYNCGGGSIKLTLKEIDLGDTFEGITFVLVQDTACTWVFDEATCDVYSVFADPDCGGAETTYTGISVILTRTGAGTGTLEIRVGDATDWCVIFSASIAGWTNCEDAVTATDTAIAFACPGASKAVMGYGGTAQISACGYEAGPDPAAENVLCEFTGIQIWEGCQGPSLNGGLGDMTYGVVSGGSALDDDYKFTADFEATPFGWGGESWQYTSANAACAADPDGHVICCENHGDAGCSSLNGSSDYIVLGLYGSCSATILRIGLVINSSNNITLNGAAIFYAKLRVPSNWSVIRDIPNEFLDAGDLNVSYVSTCDQFLQTLNAQGCQVWGYGGTVTLTKKIP